ncbi:ATP-dependent DNA ligase [Frigoribacterium endophyticum]|uniref:DUF7882 family protein n=1 Tax=Frigoribacterium endophyticum TaxID=1522176 RepID=UPI001422CA22|nr:ATP-dependent DNA ligase [Frigoribacterium endophyticum]NII52120.1 hypothetical protein [Frigoribacterium endophyticum]
MGFLLYDHATTDIRIPDRTLAHLQVVIVSKLRRNESFAFSYVLDPEAGSGRNTLWMHPAIGLRFSFEGVKVPSLNKDWLLALTQSAHSGTGLHVLPEPGPASETQVS